MMPPGVGQGLCEKKEKYFSVQKILYIHRCVYQKISKIVIWHTNDDNSQKRRGSQKKSKLFSSLHI